MKKLAIGILAATALSGSALAADMRLKAAPMAAPVAVYNWTGFYIGANGGWVGSANGVQPLTGTDTGGGGLGTILRLGFIPATFNLNASGFIGGVQAGYSW
jgi:outer membrane immunogenic protein